MKTLTLAVLLSCFAIGQDVPPVAANFTHQLNAAGGFTPLAPTWPVTSIPPGVVAINPSGSMTIFHGGAAGLAFNWWGICQPLPVAPYTYEVGIVGHIVDKSASLGIALYDSATSKFVVYSLPGSSDTGVNSLAAWKFSSPTTYVGPPYFTITHTLLTGGLLPKYFRIRDTGTLRLLMSSHEKEVWTPLHAIGNTDHVIPTHVCYVNRGSGNGWPSSMTVSHERITTP